MYNLRRVTVADKNLTYISWVSIQCFNHKPHPPTRGLTHTTSNNRHFREAEFLDFLISIEFSSRVKFILCRGTAYSLGTTKYNTPPHSFLEGQVDFVFLTPLCLVAHLKCWEGNCHFYLANRGLCIRDLSFYLYQNAAFMFLNVVWI